MALSPGQLNYWRARTKRPNLTLGQAAYQRAQAKLNPTAAPSPATKTWLLPNKSGLTGQQQLYRAYMAKNPTAKLPTPAGGVPAPADPTVDPSDARDATYFAQVAKQRFEAQQRRAQLDQQSSEALTGYTESSRRMQEQTPLQLRAATASANKAGLLYSGTLGKNLGDINTQAIRSQLDLRSNYDQGERARQAARDALEQGATVDEAAAEAEAVDRGIARDQTAATNRALVAESPIPPDQQDAGVDVGTPTPKKGKRVSTQATPKYLPKGYSNWSLTRRRAYWQARRKARR